MDRRTFLKTTTVAAGSGLALSTPGLAGGDESAIAAPAISRGITGLRFASTWPAGVPVFGDAAQRLRTRLGELLDGKWNIVATGPSDEADLTFGPVSVEQEPAFAFFAGLPGTYGLEPAQLQAWLTVGGGQMLWDELSAQNGIKPLLAGHTGPRPGLWAGRPLWSVNDLDGQAVMVSGIGVAVAHRLGANPRDLPASELADALADGRVTALEWGNPLAALMLRLPQVATHFYSDGLHKNGTAIALNVRLGIWEGLDAGTRLALENLAAHELAVSLAESLAHARLAEQVLGGTPNLEITNLPPSLTLAIDQVTVALMDEIGTRSLAAGRIRDSYLAFRSLLTAPYHTA